MSKIPLRWLITGSFVTTFLLGLFVASWIVYSALFYILWESSAIRMDSHLRYVLGDISTVDNLDPGFPKDLIRAERPAEVPDDYILELQEIASNISSDSYYVNLLDLDGKILTNAPLKFKPVPAPNKSILLKLNSIWKQKKRDPYRFHLLIHNATGPDKTLSPKQLAPLKGSAGKHNKPGIRKDSKNKSLENYQSYQAKGRSRGKFRQKPNGDFFFHIPRFIRLFHLLFSGFVDDTNIFGPLRHTYSPSLGRQTVIIPLANEGIIIGYAQVTASWFFALHFLEDFAKIISLSAIIIGIAISAISFWIAKILTDPVRHVAQAAQKVAQGDLKTRTNLPDGRNEIYMLGANFDSMVDRLETMFYEQSRFIGDASHELKTPITSLLGTAHVLSILSEQSPTDPKRSQTLETMERELNRMSDIVTDLLTLSKSTELKQNAPSDPCNLNELIEDSIQASLAATLGRQIRFTRVPDTWILADQRSLSRALRNLIDNALRYSSNSSEVALEVTINKSEACITVIDHGIGIAPEHLAQIGKRFYRADAGRARKSGGTGLGLAIATAIIHRHKGRLVFDSVVNSGTQAHVYLPIISDENLEK